MTDRNAKTLASHDDDLADADGEEREEQDSYSNLRCSDPNAARRSDRGDNCSSVGD